VTAPRDTDERHVTEWCRHDKRNGDRCNRPAIVIVWGKLAARNELGPRCRDHLPKWLNLGRVDQYAVFDLRGLTRQRVRSRWRCAQSDRASDEAT
jgi:hypothetical protein